MEGTGRDSVEPVPVFVFMVLARLRGMFDDESGTSHCECRDCGRTLAADDSRCTICGSMDVVRYDWSD